MAAPVHPPLGAEGAARRASGGIFAGVVLATCGVYAAVTMAPIVAYDVTGSVFLAGLPVAALLAGAGLGASRVTALVGRYGHQRAFAAVYLLGAGACLLAVVAALGFGWCLAFVAASSLLSRGLAPACGCGCKDGSRRSRGYPGRPLR